MITPVVETWVEFYLNRVRKQYCKGMESRKGRKWGCSEESWDHHASVFGLYLLSTCKLRLHPGSCLGVCFGRWRWLELVWGVDGGDEEREEWPVLVTGVESPWEEEGHGNVHSLYVLFSDIFWNLTTRHCNHGCASLRWLEIICIYCSMYVNHGNFRKKELQTSEKFIWIHFSNSIFNISFFFQAVLSELVLKTERDHL